MKEVRLINSELVTLVDDEDYEKVNKHRWYELIARNRNTIYARATINQKNISLHIFLLGIKNEKEIDHKDRNGLNNQRYNLRFLTHSENKRNVSIKPNNTSGYIGVSWYEKLEKYHTQIRYNNKTIHLGYYNCKIEAAKVYDSVCKFHFKGIAQLNFPDNDTILPKSIEEIKKILRSKFDIVLINIVTSKIIYKGDRQNACKLLNINRYTLTHRLYNKSKVNNIIIKQLKDA